MQPFGISLESNESSVAKHKDNLCSLWANQHCMNRTKSSNDTSKFFLDDGNYFMRKVEKRSER